MLLSKQGLSEVDCSVLKDKFTELQVSCEFVHLCGDFNGMPRLTETGKAQLVKFYEKIHGGDCCKVLYKLMAFLLCVVWLVFFPFPCFPVSNK